MEPRIFHGDLTPIDISQVLIAEFNHGNWRAQQIGEDDQVIVQIASREFTQVGGKIALSIAIRKVEDGVSIQMGKQNWLGVAASLGQTALYTWLNPINLLSRLDDLAQDIENLQLSEQAWKVIENTAHAMGASYEISERLRRMVCSYCDTPNPLAGSNCIACGAPLGYSQPQTCKKCGFVLQSSEGVCPNCGQRV